MPATSVTGRGLGSAVPNNKGSEHSSMGVGHLIGPRVVAGGSTALSGGAAVIKLPLLEGAITDYIVMTNDITANNASNGVLSVAGGNTVLTLAGTSTDTIQWQISKIGTSGLQGIGS